MCIGKSGTKVFMNGLIIHKLCVGGHSEKQTLEDELHGYFHNSTVVLFALPV